MEQKRWMSVADVASYLNLSPEMIYKLVQRGELPAIRIGSSWRIDSLELERWLEIRRMDSRKVALSKEHSAVLGELKRRLKGEYGDRFKGLYIFGSVARGEANDESDLDVLVVLKEDSDKRAERRNISRIAYDITFGEGRAIVLAIVVASEKELMDSCEPLFQRIREEGRVAA